MDDKKVIAIIEDDEQTLSVYNRLLSKKYKLDFYKSCEEFISSTTGQIQFDLTIIDLSLRGELSGIDAIEYLKSNESTKHIPAICITAHAFQKDRILAMKAGADEFFVKPVRNQNLLNVLEKYLSVQS